MCSSLEIARRKSRRRVLMLLPFSSGLIRTTHFDPEMAALADRHYSRQTPGARQFAGNGEKIVLRDTAGLILFVWLRQKQRRDALLGYNCQWFRNESPRRASDIILEAEHFAIDRWGPGSAFTFVDPMRIRLVKRRGDPVPGFCFIKAGWRYLRESASGKLILVKELVSLVCESQNEEPRENR